MSTLVTLPAGSMQTVAATTGGTSARFVLPTVGDSPESRVTAVGGTTTGPTARGATAGTGVGVTGAGGVGFAATGGGAGGATGAGGGAAGFSTVLSCVASTG